MAAKIRVAGCKHFQIVRSMVRAKNVRKIWGMCQPSSYALTKNDIGEILSYVDVFAS